MQECKNWKEKTMNRIDALIADKKIIIIAGPNGAGKTTFARTFLPTEVKLTVDMAIARVAERVRQGGHHIPEAVIRRRFAAGIQNFERYYRAAVNDWALFDNSGGVPALLEWGENV